MTNGYHVHANGIRHHLIHFHGTGPTLLVVPGITSPAITWAFAAERLTPYFNVHVLDVRGRGLSQAGDLDYSLDAMAEDLLAIADLPLFDKPIVLGHSMGGRNAIRAAKMRQDAFSGLIIVDPPVSGPGRRDYPAKLPWFVDSITLANKGCTAEEMREFCPTWTEEQLALRAEWLSTCQLDAVIKTYEGFHDDDIHTDWAGLTLPMRLVVAGSAPVIQDEDVKEIQAFAQHMDIVTVANAGHMIPWDNLEGFIEAVADFRV